MLDLFSRFVVGWMIAEEETAVQGQHFIATTCTRHSILPGQLTIHADRGAPMKAKTTAQLLVDLGIAESHSRPRVSDDNPFSEAQFKTLKYAPGYPKQFESRAHAQDWAQGLFDWYNYRHHHTALALFTPADVYFGRVEEKWAVRQAALDAGGAGCRRRWMQPSPLTRLVSAIGVRSPNDRPTKSVSTGPNWR
jgi:transposase InsO family protein